MRIYGELDEKAVHELADEWTVDDRLREFSEDVEAETIEQGRLDPQEVAERLDLEDDERQSRCYAYLRGLDAALQLVHPDCDDVDRGALDPIATRFRRHNRLNSDAADGALLPRFSFPDHFRAMDDDMPIVQKSDLFHHVIVAGADAWAQISSVRIARHHSPPANVRLDGLVVGCAPMCGGDDVAITCMPPPPRRRYLIAPTGDAVAARIAGVIRQLDESAAHIAVMPELTLDRNLLATWQAQLASIPVPSGSQLRLLMVGSGPLESFPDGRVVNRAVLLHRSGRLLLTQDKRHPFALDERTVATWGLVDDLGPGAAAEPIVPGERLCVAEGPFGRMVVLVCEDLGRTVSDGPLLIAAGPSLCVVPVLSKPTREHFWEHSRAKALSAEIGTNTVVANSLVVVDRQVAAGIPPEGRGTALAHTPAGYVGAATADPGEVVLLRLHPDGAVPLTVTRPEP